jgi:hypothetical protein
MLEHFYEKTFSLEERWRVLKMLVGFTADEQGRAVGSMAAILLQALLKGRLFNILFRVSVEQSRALMVSISEEETVELRILLASSKHQLESQILREGLNLYVGLLRKGSKEQIQIMRTIIPENMIEYYLQENVASDFKDLFMHCLNEVYLWQHQ